MKKENFEYIENTYLLETKDYILAINEEIFSDETINYTNKIAKRFQKEKKQILDYLLEKRLREYYGSKYDDEYIKNNLGKPKITVDFKKDDNHPNWKFEYAGCIEFIHNKLDEHIISIEFVDDLKLSNSVQMDG